MRQLILPKSTGLAGRNRNIVIGATNSPNWIALLVSRMYDDRVKSFSSVGHVDEETQKNAQLTNRVGSRDVKI